MIKKTLNIEFSEYASLDELSSETIDLIKKAENNIGNAYAPYSNFKVSSLCLMENDKIVLGTNQENGAYPSGLCAERVAAFAAKSQFPDVKILKIVILTDQNSTKPLSPCGSCRQVLLEYENAQNQSIEVVLKSNGSPIWEFKSINDLLPFAFDGSTILKKA